MKNEAFFNEHRTLAGETTMLSGNFNPETRCHIPEERGLKIPLSALKDFSFINFLTRMRMRCDRLN
jgi:hypothetical protein